MNQILVSEKLYVTPELKKKKKIFKFEFIISVFLLCIFSSYAVYSEYDRNKSEQVSKEILNEMDFSEKSIIPKKEEVIVIVLNEVFKDNEAREEQETQERAPEAVVTEQKVTAKDGIEYSTIGVIEIPSIEVNYPILATTTTELLKISPCRFWGPNPNEIGNLCIVGHNYKNSQFFSNVPTLEKGDIINITDLTGTTLTYIIYDKYIVDPENVECTSQLTNGRREVTLITCTNDNQQRHIIKAREM